MKNFNKHENGVALLFALGLLSLMSVLGVAFVANSLTAQKTAVNLGARNQAQIVLDSAVNRIMITLMALLRQDQTTTDFCVIYSTNDGNPRQTSGEANATFDQLNGTNSKLNMALTGLPRYEGEKSKATWVYVRDTGGRIIARMAYQVLPTGTSSLSLDRVLKGIYNPLTQALVEGADKNTIAWNQRIGKDISELYIGKASAFRQEWSVDNDSNQALPGSSVTTIVSSFAEFFNTDIYKIIGEPTNAGADAARQTWLRRWFSESTAASPEAFYVTGSPETKMEEATAYHRFNLGLLEGTPADKWYSRIDGFADKGEEIKNSSKAVKHLRAEGLKFYPEDTENPPGSGIPYLRSMIGKNKGSFADIKNRRNQIAANLNDYCDGDDTPTSDVPAKEWSNEKVPTYTGNEKTPYINEFALELDLNPTWTNTAAQTRLLLKPQPAFFTEIIDIYGGLNTTDYTAKAWLKNIAYKIEVSVEGKATLEDNSEGDFTVVKTGEYSTPSDAPIEGISFSPANAGYAVGRKELSQLEDVTIDLTEEIKQQFPEKTIVTKNISAIKITVKEVSFTLEAAALFRTSDSTGVDFVRGPGNAITAANQVILELNGSLSPTDSSIQEWKKVYLSGMEVRDPRQNLNFTKELTNQSGTAFKEVRNEWKCVPKLQNRLDSTSMTGNTVGSMEIQASSFTGKINSCANPAAPFNTSDDRYDENGAGVPGEDYDKENVTDPAWKGTDVNGHISTAFIRNAPMQSLWELGAIHRAAPWQTINIKAASVTADSTIKRIELSDNQPNAAEDKEGNEYIDGDGILLDQVKLTGKAYSGGKLDVNMLHEVVPATPDPGYNTAWNADMCRALLANVRYGQQLSDLKDLPTTPVANAGTVINWNNVPVSDIQAKPEGRTGNNAGKYVSRADFVQGAADPQGTITKFLANGFGLLTNYDNLPDAQQEELVGKTVNLLTAGATAPTTIQAVVIVQTIKGIAATAGNPITFVRPSILKNGSTEVIEFKDKNNNDLVVKSDSDGKYVYSDEITSETRALVTIKKVQDAHGIRLQLQNIQYY